MSGVWSQALPRQRDECHRVPTVFCLFLIEHFFFFSSSGMGMASEPRQVLHAYRIWP